MNKERDFALNSYQEMFSSFYKVMASKRGNKNVLEKAIMY